MPMQVEKSIAALTDALGNRGYAFVDIKPHVTRNRETHTIDITFDVQEGPQVYVERIDIIGNVRTLDKVIRREFRLVEGDAFNTTQAAALAAAHQESRLLQEGRGHQQPGHRRPTRRSSTSRSRSNRPASCRSASASRPPTARSADISIRERNFLGRGQDLRIGTVVVAALAAGRSQLHRALFPRPQHRRRLRSLRDQTSPTNFSSIAPATSSSLRRRAARRLSDHREPAPDAEIHAALRTTSHNVQTDASLFIALQQGTRIDLGDRPGSALRPARQPPRPDARLFRLARQRFRRRSAAVCVIVRNKVNGGYYYSVAPEWVLSVTGEAGYIFGWAAAGAHRGPLLCRRRQSARLRHRPASARAISATDDALGGNNYYVGSVSLGVPLGLPKELGITGRVFTDFGSSVQPSNDNRQSTRSPIVQLAARSSAGGSASPGHRRLVRSGSISLYRSRRKSSTRSNSSGSASARGSECPVSLAARIAAASVAGALIALASPPASLLAPSRRQQPLPAPVILIVDVQQILQDAKAAKVVQAIRSSRSTAPTPRKSRSRRMSCRRRATSWSGNAPSWRRSVQHAGRDFQQRYDALDQVSRARQALQQASTSDGQVKNAALEVIADIVKERKANLVIDEAGRAVRGGRHGRHRRRHRAARQEIAALRRRSICRSADRRTGADQTRGSRTKKK